MNEKSIHMSPEDFKLILDNNDPSYLILDVRTPSEHNEKNLGGVNIPLNELFDRASAIDFTKKIITYCKVGGRSQRACEILLQIGATEVYSLVGGIEGYK